MYRSRILQVCNTDFYLNKFLAPLVRALVAGDHQVACVCEGGGVDRTALGDDVVVHPFRFPRTSSPLEFARAVARLRKIIRLGGYQCVDSHNRNASIVARIAARLERVPINLYTAHGFYFHDDQSRVAREATIVLEAVLARITDFTLSQSAADIELMVGRRLISSDRIEEIGNGIDIARFTPRGERSSIERDLRLRNGRFRVSATGRLVKGKGFGDLLRAFASLHQRHAEAELMIIGGNIDQDISPYQTEFLAEVAQRDLSEAVVVTGLTNQVEKYLAATDVFVLPSYREGMPRALLEAMSMALPVIATDIRGCREIVSPGRTGLLYPPHDVDRLAELLFELYHGQRDRADLGKRARALVVERFDETLYVSRQVRAIERLLRANEILREPLIEPNDSLPYPSFRGLNSNHRREGDGFW